jgi:YesN/AraC family two-component response regulator
MQQKFDVLIADLNISMPGDGFTVISAMRSAQPEALRLILTGFPDFESALRAIQEQVHEYVIKPAEIDELVAKIRTWSSVKPPSRRDYPRQSHIHYSGMVEARE